MVASPPSWRKSPAAFLEPVVDRFVASLYIGGGVHHGGISPELAKVSRSVPGACGRSISRKLGSNLSCDSQHQASTLKR
jgi:hypothetical protein